MDDVTPHHRAWRTLVPLAVLAALTASGLASAAAPGRLVPRILERPPTTTASTSARWRFTLPTGALATCRVDRRAARPCSAGAFRVDGVVPGRHRFTLQLRRTGGRAAARSTLVQTWVVSAGRTPDPPAPPAVTPPTTAPWSAPAAPSTPPADTSAATTPTAAPTTTPTTIVPTVFQAPPPVSVPVQDPVVVTPDPTPAPPTTPDPVQAPATGGQSPAATTPGSGTIAQQSSTPLQAVGEADAGSSPRRVMWGSYVVGSRYGISGNPPWDMSGLDAFEADAGGKHVSILHLGQPWFAGGVAQPFYPGPLDAIRRRGAIPLIDWNSWDTANGGSETQPAFQLADITRGVYDPMIRTWALGARAWGKPLFLRFDHEMNGRWFPWSEIRNGNATGDFVRAWRHVHDIFTAAGVTNVTWVWSPNVAFDGSIPLAGLYPGDAYVDWVGLDGYNWGANPIKPAPWVTFAQLIGPTYAATGLLAPTKPVMIAEFGSSEYGGSKAAWITDALSDATLDAFPRIGALLWFNWGPEGVDWTIESSTSARAAFAEGIASPRFTGGAFGSLPGSVIAPPPG